MRIGLLGTVRTLEREVRPELLPLLPAGTEVTAWPSRVGAFPATPLERALQAIGHLDAGLAAAAAGMDALAIDSVGDYGLDALRAGLALPVVGAGEAGVTAAARHGRFAIVTVWPASMNFVPVELLRSHGVTDQCLGIRNVGEEAVIGDLAGPDGYLGRVHRADQPIFARVVAAVEEAAAAGAEAVMLGCTCMSPMAAKVASAVRVPVINPLAEAAMSAARLAVGQTRAEPAIRTERAAVVARMVDAVAGEADEACPVCVAEDFAG